MKRKNKIIIVNLFLIFIVLMILVFVILDIYKENKIGKSNYDVQGVSTKVNNKEENKINENKTNKEKKYIKEDVTLEYKGYTVISKLEIPKIDLETYVLEKYLEETLNISVVKFYGANPNEVGNFCIAGHNFKNKNMFKNLKKLSVGDNLFIIDNDIGRVEYEIFDIYKVSPNDVACLSQETNGKREVTLITCTNDSKERIIVKAREKE